MISVARGDTPLFLTSPVKLKAWAERASAVWGGLALAWWTDLDSRLGGRVDGRLWPNQYGSISHFVRISNRDRFRASRVDLSKDFRTAINPNS
jgi:hypothetical protein